ncbi:synaptopodin 2-like protein [Littorina saxatilis]|uniref:PDZ domain-containing protein n=1 Tax=Littorina saxatilis TaxID=31220 RepID=A0AAN9GKH1_9CAEN
MNSHDDSYDGCEYVTLVRKSNTQPWGFRMMGGLDQASCLYIAKVNQRSLGQRFGLRPGDAVMRIGQVPATHLNHDAAKAEILRAGNELHFLIKRNAVQVPQEDPTPKGRSEVVEEHTQYLGNRNPTVQSRSFRIITETLVEEIGSLEGNNSGLSVSNATAFR